MPDLEIAYMGGHWSSNVGNSYYDLGALWMLRNEVSPLTGFWPDHPLIWDHRITPRFEFEREFSVDLLLSGGPILDAKYLQHLTPLWRAIQDRGGHIGFVSAGLVDYSRENARRTREVIAELDPAFIVTRDYPTYAALAEDFPVTCRPGLCYSIFLPNAVGHLPALRAESTQYVLFNFGRGNEPPDLEGRVMGSRVTGPHAPQRIVRSSTQTFPSDQRLFGRWGGRILGSRYRSTFNSYDFYTDNPLGNAALIANAKAVYSDRVHTCAAALSFGTPAQYFAVDKASSDGRFNLLLDLVGPRILHEPTVLPPERRELIQKSQTRLLTEQLQRLFPEGFGKVT